VSARVQDMTMLTVDTAEELQVVNYGVGGHYAPHYDFSTVKDQEDISKIGFGNRVATTLFYVSSFSATGKESLN
jgi:prolyl 4-hydroxylase